MHHFGSSITGRQILDLFDSDLRALRNGPIRLGGAGGDFFGYFRSSLSLSQPLEEYSGG